MLTRAEKNECACCEPSTLRTHDLRRTPDLGVPMTFAGVVWHFWIAVPLAVAGILSIVATIVGYLQKVTYKRYPRD